MTVSNIGSDEKKLNFRKPVSVSNNGSGMKFKEVEVAKNLEQFKPENEEAKFFKNTDNESKPKSRFVNKNNSGGMKFKAL